MKSFLVMIFAMAPVLAINAPAVVLAQNTSALATLRAADGREVGSATFTETAVGVEIALKVHGMPAGRHGFHIHAKGSCEPPEFKSAGGHFNPEGKKHGLNNPQGHHLGDLPNLEVGPDGKGEAKVVAAGVTLGKGENSLLRKGGTALVIHAGADDEKSDPAGNAGPRIACGLIRPASQ